MSSIREPFERPLQRNVGYPTELGSALDASRLFHLCVIGIVIAVGMLRICYSIWLSPWDLLGDEAYYWVQGQHPALSYVEKGPLLAWMLALSDWAFGHHVWVVRLPVVLGSITALWLVAALTYDIAHDRAATLISMGVFLLTPAFIANSQICTQDGLEVPLFVALAFIGLKIVRRIRDRESNWSLWIAYHALIGVGLLLKQSTVLYATAMPTFVLFIERDRQLVSRLILRQVVGVLIICAFSVPLLLWESQHHWPMLQHTLGHLGVGESQFASRKNGNPVIWVTSAVGAIVGSAGPMLLAVCLQSFSRTEQTALLSSKHRDLIWLHCTAWPSILFYLALSFTKPIVASWPLPSLVTLIPIAAVYFRDVVAARAKANAGRVWLFRVGFGYGLASLLLLSFPSILAHLPVVGEPYREKVLSRFSNQESKAAAVDDVLRAHPNIHLVIAPNYAKASLLSFYLRTPVTVTSAGDVVGERLSNFDEWPETTLTQNSRWLGSDALLYAGSEDSWNRALSFDSIHALSELMYEGKDFHGSLKVTGDHSVRSKP